MAEADYYVSISELSERIREQEISPVQVVNSCLKRIAHLNPSLNAFITILADHAIGRAKIAEAEIKGGHWRGPLHGIPVGIKDFYDTAGIRTTAASKGFTNRIPTRDAAGVAKLKDAGAIMIGKMNMHELGMGTTSLVSAYGPVHNPWKIDHIAGGSSGGAAAAVASGMCCATLDTDAVGSCRLPASCCGVVGFKGTYGLISSKGILEGEKADEIILWLSHPGITTRTVEKTTLVLNVLAEDGAQAGAVDFHAVLDNDDKLRIGIVNNFEAESEVLAAFEKAIDTLQQLDHPTSSASAPFDTPRWDARTIEADRKVVIEQFFAAVDVLVLPTTTTPTPAIRDAGANPLALSPNNTFFPNYYGLPAVSVPCGFDSNGLPLGLQIVGKPQGDHAVLRLAHRYQEAVQQGSAGHPVP